MTSSLTSVREAPLRVLRFDAVQRAAHWANAALFFALIVTAIPLYFGSLFGLNVPRHTMAQIHLWCGLALVAPVVVAVCGPWGRRMRADLRRVNYWTHDEIDWLRTLGRSGRVEDKFNPGQKLNVIVVGASVVVMLGTGAMLQWFRFFSPSLRTGATFVHDVGAFAVVAVIAGHLWMSFTHPQALRSMFTGYVSRVWAREHAPGWLVEDSGLDGPPPA